MTVKTAGIANLSQGAKVKAIQEDGAEFSLQFEDGSAVTLQLADPGASVAVRDKVNRVKTSAEILAVISGNEKLMLPEKVEAPWVLHFCFRPGGSTGSAGLLPGYYFSRRI